MIKKIVTIVLLTSFAIYAHGQNTITLSGFIRDKDSNKPIPGATITIGNDGTVSNESGFYTLQSIHPSSSKLNVRMVGYNSIEKKLDLTNNTNHTLNFFLKEKPIELTECVITGTRTRKPIDNSPILTKVIKEEEIKEIGAVTAFDAIESLMPGVQFSPDAHGDNIQIRGLGNEYILVLVDGERLVNETRGNVNFNRINASDIKQIEIINGSSSVLYGSNAMGAVINIITKDANKPISGRIGSRYSKYNTHNSSFRIETEQNKFSLTLNGFRNSSDGYTLKSDTVYSAQDTISPITINAQGYTDYSGGMKATYKINDIYKIKAHANYYKHENILPENSLKSIHRENDNISGGINTVADFSKKHQMQFNINSDLYRGYKVYEKKNDSTFKYADYQYTTFLLTDAYCFNPKLEMVSGLELNAEEIFSKDLFGTDITNDKKNKDATDFSTFVQLDWFATQKLEIIGGARYTHHSAFGSHFTPKISMMYKLKRFKFRGNIARGYKSPTLKELYYNFDHQGMFWIYGNPDLLPENANYFSFSSEYTKGSINVSINAYYNKITNKIESISLINSVSQKMEFHYKNITEAEIKGIETYIYFTLFSHLKIRLAYTFADTEDKSTGMELYGNSHHSGTATFTWKIADIKAPICISVSGKAASSRLYQYVTENYDPFTGDTEIEKNKKESDPYMLWNASYTQNFTIYKNFSLDIHLGVNNIFDYSELYRSAVINPGRTYYGGLTLYF